MKLKAKQKRQLITGLFAAVAAFFIWVIVFMNVTVGPETSEFVTKQNEWTNKLVANFLQYHIIYLVMLAVILVGYLFLSRKRK